MRRAGTLVTLLVAMLLAVPSAHAAPFGPLSPALLDAPPTPVITSPHENDTVGPGSFLVTGTAQADVNVRVYADGTVDGSTQANDDGNWSVAVSDLDPGPHQLSADAYNADGASDRTASIDVTVDYDTIEVTSTSDSSDPCTGNQCPSLRAAVALTVNHAGSEAIELPAGTIALGDTLGLASDMRLDGNAGGTTIAYAGTASPVLQVFNSAISLNHLHVQGGSDAIQGVQPTTLSLDHVYVSGAAEDGLDFSGGTLAIDHVTIADNGGFGIEDLGDTTSMTVNETTIAGNRGGGLHSAAEGNSTIFFTGVTLAQNALGAAVDNAFFGVADSIFAGNTRGNCFNHTHAVSQDGNVESGTDCGFTGAHDLQSADPKLASTLSSDALPVLTLGASSPAIDLIDSCDSTDELDTQRPQGAGCDAGAYESEPSAHDTVIDSGPATPGNQSTVTFTFHATPADGSRFRCEMDDEIVQLCASGISYSVSDGTHTFHVAAAGDATPADYTFSVDTTEPAAPHIRGTSRNGSTYGLSGTSDPGTTIQIFEGASPVAGQQTTVQPDGQWTATFPGPSPNGLHTFYAVATDAADNTSPDSNTQTLRIGPDLAAPAIATPAEGATVGTSFTVSGTAEVGTTIELDDDSGLTPVGSTTTAQDGTWSFSLTGVKPGDHTYAVTATDALKAHAQSLRTVDVQATSPDTVIDTGPEGTVNSRSATFTFHSTLSGSTFTCQLDNQPAAPCTSPQTYTNLADGPHQFTVAADGDASPDSDSWTVDATAPTAPAITQATVDGTSVTLSGTAVLLADIEIHEGGQVVATTATSDGGPGDWSVTFVAPDGLHAYTATATDRAGNASTASAVRYVRVGPAPAAPTFSTPDGTVVGSSSVTLNGSAEPADSVTVSEGGAPVATTAAGDDGGWTVTLDNVSEGSHAYTASAKDASGAQSAPSQPVNVTVATPTPTPTPQAAASPTATPTATPVPTETPVPTPTYQQTVVVKPISGTVLVRKPGTNQFVPVDASSGIPLGSTIDVKQGKIQLTSATGPGGAPQKAQFYGGIFQVTQTGSLVDLTLNEPLAACPKKGKSASVSAKKPKSRQLWGSGSGAFRTRGKYSAATVRGTTWLVHDSCAGTLTKVTQGVVSVRDNVHRKTVLVRAGKHYLAAAPH